VGRSREERSVLVKAVRETAVVEIMVVVVGLERKRTPSVARCVSRSGSIPCP